MPGALLLGAASASNGGPDGGISSDETRGAVNAAFYTLAYLGFGAPVVVTALAGEAMTVPYAVLAAVSLVLSGWLVVVGRRVVPA